MSRHRNRGAMNASHPQGNKPQDPTVEAVKTPTAAPAPKAGDTASTSQPGSGSNSTTADARSADSAAQRPASAPVSTASFGPTSIPAVQPVPADQGVTVKIVYDSAKGKYRPALAGEQHEMECSPEDMDRLNELPKSHHQMTIADEVPSEESVSFLQKRPPAHTPSMMTYVPSANQKPRTEPKLVEDNYDSEYPRRTVDKYTIDPSDRRESHVILLEILQKAFPREVFEDLSMGYVIKKALQQLYPNPNFSPEKGDWMGDGDLHKFLVSQYAYRLQPADIHELRMIMNACFIQYAALDVPNTERMKLAFGKLQSLHDMLIGLNPKIKVSVKIAYRHAVAKARLRIKELGHDPETCEPISLTA